MRMNDNRIKTTPTLQQQADRALICATGANRAAEAAMEVATVEEAKYLRLTLQSIAQRHPAVHAFGCECEYPQHHDDCFETIYLSVQVDETLPDADQACALGEAEEDVAEILVSTEAAKLVFGWGEGKATLSLAQLQNAQSLVSPSAAAVLHPVTEGSV